jgi:cobalamin biosynthesis Co2+ chelatase CbiK
MSEVLIARAIIALVTLGLEYKEAKNITKADIQKELDKVFEEYDKLDPNLLPEV